MSEEPPPEPPVRRLLVIGIGAGDPFLVTVQAAASIALVDVFVVIDKGESAADLAMARQVVLEQCGREDARTVVVRDQVRDPSLPYEEGVARWHLERVEAIERLLLDEVDPLDTAGILVWGDPSLYDSTLRIVDQINERGALAVRHDVVPGISALQVLTARHRIPLNRVGGSVLITTGRQLRSGLPEGVDDAVVLLDAENSFTTLVGQGYEIFWGAFLGSPDELLVAGPLDDVADEIVRTRAAARAAKGWMFDTYLLRRQRT